MNLTDLYYKQVKENCASFLGFAAAYCLPIYATFGLITNAHTIYIFMVPLALKTRLMVYLSAVAFADCLNIISIGWLWMFASIGLGYASNYTILLDTFKISSAVCILHRTLNAVTACLTTSMYVLACVDRCMAVCFPVKFRSTTIKQAYLFCTVIVLSTFMLSLPLALNTRYFIGINGDKMCMLGYGSEFWVFYEALFFNCGLCQSCLILLANLALAFKLCETVRARAKLTHARERHSLISSSEIKASLLIVIMSSIYLICSIPQAVFYIGGYILSKSGKKDLQAQIFWSLGDIMWVVFLFQESTTWVIYTARMANFRKYTFFGYFTDISLENSTVLTPDTNKVHDVHDMSK